MTAFIGRNSVFNLFFFKEKIRDEGTRMSLQLSGQNDKSFLLLTTADFPTVKKKSLSVCIPYKSCVKNLSQKSAHFRSGRTVLFQHNTTIAKRN